MRAAVDAKERAIALSERLSEERGEAVAMNEGWKPSRAGVSARRVSERMSKRRRKNAL